MIREGKIFQVPTAIATGKKNGMFTLDQDLARLVNMGKITKEVALTRCQDPNELSLRWILISRVFSRLYGNSAAGIFRIRGDMQ